MSDKEFESPLQYVLNSMGFETLDEYVEEGTRRVHAGMRVGDPWDGPWSEGPAKGYEDYYEKVKRDAPVGRERAMKLLAESKAKIAAGMKRIQDGS